MKLLVDTADAGDIRLAAENFPIVGVTTNPTLLARACADPVARLHEIREIIGNGCELHIQLTVPTDDFERAVAEGRAIDAAFGDNVCIKVPVSQSGLRVTEALTSAGVAVTETAVFTPAEALLAARAGAKYVAPYVNRLIEAGEDGIGVVTDIRRLFDLHRLPCEILAASFHELRQVCAAALAGAHCATLSYGMLRSMASHPLTDKAIAGFGSDWKAAFGDATLLGLLKN